MSEQQCFFGVPAAFAAPTLLEASAHALAALRPDGALPDVDAVLTPEPIARSEGFRGLLLLTSGAPLDEEDRSAFVEHLVGGGVPLLRVLVDDVHGLALVDAPHPTHGRLVLGSDGEEVVGPVARVGMRGGPAPDDPHALARQALHAWFPRLRHPDTLLELLRAERACALIREGRLTSPPTLVPRAPGAVNLFPWWPSDDDWDHALAHPEASPSPGRVEPGAVPALLDRLGAWGPDGWMGVSLGEVVAAYRRGARAHAAERASCERSMGTGWAALGDAHRAIEHLERALALGADPEPVQADIDHVRSGMDP